MIRYCASSLTTLVGFIVCIFSLANAFGLVYLDRRAEKEDPENEAAVVSEEDKFKWSDLYQFDLSFWLLTGSCALTYMSIFPYIQVASDLLQTKYHFDKITAGYLFGIPYIISAVSSPLLGILIDQVGKIVMKRDISVDELNGSALLDVSSLANGIYHCTLRTQDGGQLTRKVIVQR